MKLPGLRDGVWSIMFLLPLLYNLISDLRAEVQSLSRNKNKYFPRLECWRTTAECSGCTSLAINVDIL